MICGLLGEKLSHSYSPQIHKCLGDYRYDIFEKTPDQLKEFLQSFEFRGLNVTIPYKKTVIQYCQALSPEAQKIGAVNTLIKRNDGTLIGHNTDYFGFRSMALRLGISYEGKKALVLGSGGASNTVCTVMKELGAEVIVISRSGENNYENICKHQDCAVIINATPVGMYPKTGVSPVDISIFPKLEAVMDLIYNPANTKLLLDAKQRGIRAENGLWMLVAQAKESAEWFSGKKIDDRVIENIYHKLKNQMQNVILVGMPGCGKSTIGKLLAERLQKTFVDADTQIEDFAGCSISEIFRTQQEAGFRKIETQVLSHLGKRSSQVIATGGGCVTQPENLSLLRQNGIIVWIRREVSALPTEGRPLSQSNDLRKMYEIRKPMYASFADITVDNNTSIGDAVQNILSKLEVTE